MKGYDEIEEPARTDTEITLGPRSILGIFFALALICGVFFGFGYSLGRSGGAKSAAAALTHTQTTATGPAAPLQTVVEQPGTNTAAGGSENSASVLQSSNVLASSSKPSATTAAPPAPVTAQPTPAPAAQPAAYNPPPPARTVATPKPSGRPVEGIMVQIAAVAHRHDAEALVTQLRRRGYQPVIRRGVNDHLLHVQVGPFATRRAALAMSSRLLGNGYNAILKK